MEYKKWNMLEAIKIHCNLTERDVKQVEDGNYKVEFKYDFSDKNPMGRDIISAEVAVRSDCRQKAPIK